MRIILLALSSLLVGCGGGRARPTVDPESEVAEKPQGALDQAAVALKTR